MTQVALHRNEMPRDIPRALKRRIAERIQRIPFNEYPEPFAGSLVKELAQWYGCQPGQLMVAPGSSAFIRLLFTHHAITRTGRIVIARPSFPYYEEYCQAFKIPYDTWELNAELEYDPTTIGDLPPGSLVMFASPNNPTGKPIAPADLTALLTRYPRARFVVDEAYAEFDDTSYIPLVAQYPNLMVLRTLSKALSAAGIRCGALVANEIVIGEIMLLQTPFQMSAVTIEIVKQMLAFDRQTQWSQRQIQQIIAEREQMYQQLIEITGYGWEVFPSRANFILIRAPDMLTHLELLSACNQYGLVVANLHGLPRLERCIRVSLGLAEHNRAFVNALQQSIRLSQANPFRSVV